MPIDMVLHCPKCGMQHVDAPDETREIRGGELCVETWDNPPHRSHKCKACGCIWRPADVPTNGVKAVATRGKADTWPAGVKAVSNEVAAKEVSNEVAAKAIYEQWKDLPGWTPWVEGGNSLKQDEARALAPATATSSLDHEQVKQKFLRGELGSTEMPAAQIWDAPGVKVVPWVRPQECAATGAGHHDGPYGPKGQRQCHYCGQPPSDGVPVPDAQTKSQ